MSGVLMRVEQFISQVTSAEQRYRNNADTRRSRINELNKLRAGDRQVAVEKIDSPARIARRIVGLSQDAAASEAIISGALAAQIPGEAAGDLLVLERIINQNDLLSADFLAAGARASRTVGRIVIRGGSGAPVGFGTCFMVSPRLAMTNNHVIATATEAASSVIQFDFLETLTGTQLTPVEFLIDPDEFFQTDRALDFTLFAVEPENELGITIESRGWTPLIEATGKAIVGERVNVLQHPGGERQQLALRQNQVVDVPGDFLHYTSDTERGSSGSPVLNDQWQLAALHHAGVPARNEDGNIVLLSGQPWDGTSATIDQIKWKANEGVRISRIVAELQQRSATFTQNELDLFQAAFQPPDLEAIKESKRVAGQPTYANGKLSWSFPIEFSIDVPALRPAVVTPVSRRRTARGETAERRQQLIDEFSQNGINRAKAAFALHKNDPYYDAEADEKANIEYYADIDDALVGDELFDALHALLESTHANEFSYTEARYDHLYPWVDLRENRSLASIYSGDSVDFETVIASEALIEARHAIQLQEFMAREGAFDEEAVGDFLFALESQDPFNCEHIVPQSWFNKKQPMKADLHHLITCEPSCNSSRGNNAFFEFNPDLPLIDPHCGQVKHNESKFEPVEGKGVVARATLYFLLRYPGRTGSSLDTDRLPILLNWHEDHPVSEYEKHRNAEIEKAQGNRNPLIDFPLWADAIPFERGL